MEIKTKEKILRDGTVVKTYTRTVNSLNILEVEAGTTGYQGGDTGHGGRTYFRIEDLGSTDIRPRCYETEYGNNGFEVVLGGDCELDTIIEALEFITAVLKDHEHDDNDSDYRDSRSNKYKAILLHDANRRMREYCLEKSNGGRSDFIDYGELVNWCWQHNAGHWPDGTEITDD